jgi:hypothetical protein
MKKILNYLLGEELITKHSNKEIREALIGTAMGIAFGAVCLIAVYVFG